MNDLLKLFAKQIASMRAGNERPAADEVKVQTKRNSKRAKK